MSKKSITRFVPNIKKPAKLSKEDLKVLDSLRDEDIDYSDIPELDEKFWHNAKLLRPSPKETLSLRIDTDVMSWFRAQGRDYKNYINAVLRAYTQANLNH